MLLSATVVSVTAGEFFVGGCPVDSYHLIFDDADETLQVHTV